MPQRPYANALDTTPDELLWVWFVGAIIVYIGMRVLAPGSPADSPVTDDAGAIVVAVLWPLVLPAMLVISAFLTARHIIDRWRS